MTENEWGLVREPYSHITVGGITKYLRENYGIDLTESPHALAAMSLYLQPFGFTHEEANVLRDIAQRIKAKDILIHERPYSMVSPIRSTPCCHRRIRLSADNSEVFRPCACVWFSAESV
jgi:hypothetical protein